MSDWLSVEAVFLAPAPNPTRAMALASPHHVPAPLGERTVVRPMLASARWRRRGVVVTLAGLLAVAALYCTPPRLAAQDAVVATEASSRKEFQVRYAYLYSFALMTKWPDETFRSTGDEFVIAVVGETPYRSDLNRVAETKKIRERNIRIVDVASAGAIPPCQVVYFPELVPPAQREALVRELRGKPVLTVGEAAGFANSGGVIRFFLEADNVRFELNPTAAAAQQLAVDPRMTKLAKVVGQEKAAAPAAAPATAGGN